ncbi:hypothetical protein ANO11243_089900 [Dothideomycetidae sp. 11243]|nr:hypothetical protein ANO11243_089900 [fungal sp. No.11243]
MDNLDFLVRSPSSHRTITVVAGQNLPDPVDRAFIKDVSLERLKSRCPLLDPRTNPNTRGGSLNLHSESSDVVIAFLRWVYTGCYLPAEFPCSKVSLLTHLQILKLANTYVAVGLSQRVTIHIIYYLENVARGSQMPPDLGQSINFAYKNFNDKSLALAAILNYCTRSLIGHKLEEDHAFRFQLTTLPLFHQDLCAIALYSDLDTPDARRLIQLNADVKNVDLATAHKGIDEAQGSWRPTAYPTEHYPAKAATKTNAPSRVRNTRVLAAKCVMLVELEAWTVRPFWSLFKAELLFALPTSPVRCGRQLTSWTADANLLDRSPLTTTAL